MGPLLGKHCGMNSVYIKKKKKKKIYIDLNALL
jgi:hypothetical protein